MTYRKIKVEYIQGNNGPVEVHYRGTYRNRMMEYIRRRFAKKPQRNERLRFKRYQL